MATRIANTLIFTNLAPGASVVLVHDLNNGNIKQAADIITLPSPQLVVLASTDQSITIQNQGPDTLSGAVLAEWINTPNRAFGNSGNVNLSVKPYIVVGAEIAGSPPQPGFVSPPLTLTVYARLTGNDTTGNGSLATPYRTFRRAIRDVPNFIPPGVYYRVDVTGIGVETLPNDFIMPSWKSALVTHGYDFGDPYFYALAAVRITAEPQLASALSPANQVVSIANGVWSPANLKTGFLTLTDPTKTWIPGALKGLFVKGDGGVFDTAVIIDNTATSITINFGPFPLTLPVRIMEPSATLETNTDDPFGFGRAGLYASHEDSLVLGGLRIQPVSGSGAQSFISSSGSPFFELCELVDFQIYEAEFVSELVSCNLVNGIISSLIFAITSRFSGGCSFNNAEDFGVLLGAFEGCGSVGRQSPGLLFMSGALIEDSLSDGIAHVGSGTIINVEINDSAGNGVLADGPTKLALSGVSGSGNAGVGVRVNNGAQVEKQTTTGFGGIFIRVTGATNAVACEVTTAVPHNMVTGDVIIAADIFPGTIPDFTDIPVIVTGLSTFTVPFNTTLAGPYAGGGAVWLPVKTTVTGSDDQEVGDLGPDAYPAMPFNINDIGIPGTSAGGATGTNARLFAL